MTAPLFDLEQIEILLRGSAHAGNAMRYSEVLNRLGMAFTRPKMRAMCKILDEIDRRAASAGEPELAALVVRESDRMTLKFVKPLK
jgi:predicted methyltransferase